MPAKKDVDGFMRLSAGLSAGQIGCFYIFHGEERYLLQRSLSMLRALICPDGLSSFNYKRYEGKHLNLDLLDEAIDTLPSFAERTLIEIHDFDLFSCDDKPRLVQILSNLPDYVCLVCVYELLAYKPNRRAKVNAEILNCADVVEFVLQEQSKLIKWIIMHFKDAGKNISADNAKYLAFITGGYMSSLHGEIEKTASFASGDTISRADIDAVVIPVLDTAAYKLTDALARGDHAGAMQILSELFEMKEPAHKLLFSISLKMRQLLAARVCIEAQKSKGDLIEICSLKHEFQAKALMDSARMMSLKSCREAVLHCANTAHELNSLPDPDSRLTELITKLAFVKH